METGIGRRVFVGSVVAGLPLLASSTAGAARAGWQAAHVHSEGSADPVLEHLVRQLASAHNELRRQPQGEHVRAFAAQLRTFAVYGRSIDLDPKVKKAMAQLIEREGRERVLYTESNREQVRAELKRYGAQPDERLLNRALNLDYAARTAVLDGVLASGVLAHLERTAAAIDRLAVELDRRSGAVVRVSRQDSEFWEGYCRALWSHIQETQFLTALHCAVVAVPIIGVAFVPLCSAYALAMLMLGLVYGANCWNVLP